MACCVACEPGANYRRCQHGAQRLLHTLHTVHRVHASMGIHVHASMGIHVHLPRRATGGDRILITVFAAEITVAAVTADAAAEVSLGRHQGHGLPFTGF